jgi:hypothetical protein
MNTETCSKGGLAVALALAGCSAFSAPAAAEDYWAADPVTGCQIWSDSPADTAIATWSGACVDGKASGIGSLVWVENGLLVGTYRGGMAGGKLNGPGVLQVKAEDGSGFDQVETVFADGEPAGPGAAARNSEKWFLATAQYSTRPVDFSSPSMKTRSTSPAFLGRSRSRARSDMPRPVHRAQRSLLNGGCPT